MPENQLNEVAWQLGAAIQHRNAMSGMHRNNPSVTTQEWRDEANRAVKRLQQQYRSLASKLA